MAATTGFIILHLSKFLPREGCILQHHQSPWLRFQWKVLGLLFLRKICLYSWCWPNRGRAASTTGCGERGKLMRRMYGRDGHNTSQWFSRKWGDKGGSTWIAYSTSFWYLVLLKNATKHSRCYNACLLAYFTDQRIQYTHMGICIK